MKNKGYYSWIHSMKDAAMQSHFKGQKMLNEDKAIKKPFDKAKFDASMPKQAPTVSDGEQTIDDKNYLEPTTPGTISLADGDVGLYVKLRRMKRAEQEAQMAQANGPVNAAPAGNANAVAADAQDGVMADPEFVPGPDRIHPEPWYKTPGEAAAAIAALNLQMKPRTSEEEAEADQQAADAEEMENIRREILSLGESKKFVSSMIEKFLREANIRSASEIEQIGRKKFNKAYEDEVARVGILNMDTDFTKNAAKEYIGSYISRALKREALIQRATEQLSDVANSGDVETARQYADVIGDISKRDVSGKVAGHANLPPESVAAINSDEEEIYRISKNLRKRGVPTLVPADIPAMRKFVAMGTGKYRAPYPQPPASEGIGHVTPSQY